MFKEGKISFPDGNVWPKEAGVSGVYLDPQHKEGYRVVRATSPSTVQIVLQDDPKAEVLKLAGTSASRSLPDYPFRVWSLMEMAALGIATRLDVSYAGACGP